MLEIQCPVPQAQTLAPADLSRFVFKDMLKRLTALFNQGMEKLVDSVRLRLVGPSLLGDIVQIPLRCSLEEARAAYGEPYEHSVDDGLPDCECYSFEVRNFHLVELWVWKSAVHQILYTSPRGESSLDLQTVFDAYGSGKEWVTWEEGYLYASADNSVRVWCSAMPVIGVGTTEFVHFRDSHKSDTEKEEGQ